MTPFAGFSSGKSDFTPIPSVFFTELLPKINHLGELRVSIYTFWYLDGQTEEPRYVKFSDLLADKLLVGSFGKSRGEQEKNMQDALARAVGRGTLIEASM